MMTSPGSSTEEAEDRVLGSLGCLRIGRPLERGALGFGLHGLQGIRLDPFDHEMDLDRLEGTPRPWSRPRSPSSRPSRSRSRRRAEASLRAARGPSRPRPATSSTTPGPRCERTPRGGRCAAPRRRASGWRARRRRDRRDAIRPGDGHDPVLGLQLTGAGLERREPAGEQVLSRRDPRRTAFAVPRGCPAAFRSG